MIAVDTSALMAIVLNERQAEACIVALESEDHVLISAGTVAESLIVAAHRNVRGEVATLIDGLGFDIVPVTAVAARRISDTYTRWGKGVGRAGLNFGDCFAYDVAKVGCCRFC